MGFITPEAGYFLGGVPLDSHDEPPNYINQPNQVPEGKLTFETKKILQRKEKHTGKKPFVIHPFNQKFEDIFEWNRGSDLSDLPTKSNSKLTIITSTLRT